MLDVDDILRGWELNLGFSIFYIFDVNALRALALENANAISKENLAFVDLKSSASENSKTNYCKFFPILATVQFYL